MVKQKLKRCTFVDFFQKWNLTYFLEWKLDHRFGCPLDKQSCTPNFATFRAIIFTPFTPNRNETARRIFTFYKFLRIIIWSQCSELFSTPLSQTLTKLYEGVSLLTYFLEWKLDHRFGCPLDKKSCMPNFAMFRAIILTPFKPNPSETTRQSFTLSSFLELIFAHIFGCKFDRQDCTWNFMTLWNIFTCFKPNLSKTTQGSFTFDQFLRIKIWS